MTENDIRMNIMTDPTITCPHCRANIKLTESLAAPLLEATRQQYESRLSEKESEVARREAAIREQQSELAKARDSIDQEVTNKLKQERVSIAAEEAKKARQLLANDIESKVKELTDLQEVLKQRDEKLAEAQKAQAELIRKQRELDDAKREIDLTIEKRVEESLVAVRDKAKLEAEEGLKLKVAEKEQTIFSMQKQIEELKRRAEQGSQQLQGEVQELELEGTLRTKFPRDLIEPVPKGEHGGDALHRVLGPLQQVCGTILWESKRTKNWSDGWLTKLREDQRTAKAELAVIVSQALPKDVDTFDFVEGVWVTSPRNVIPVAIALRHTLIELSLARQAGEGQQTKMELIYQYLTGPRFRHRIQAIVEKFSDMMQDLEKERRTMTRLWSKREEQLRITIESTAGMYGDLQGIAGKTLQEIEGLELRKIGNLEGEE
ncbi:MAG TPA: DUF2130 domain-containing protein [Pirellulaceae bacterium]|nr:DUF2130 domain-containing protein [Pirellulaceae bacterium]HMO93563.1 DUF2130 domain-containing protein [Pirellulaceae bacterium]HMP71112.1 DUF2130 domain-containing protein [Pirellulaceae bacterium]